MPDIHQPNTDTRVTFDAPSTAPPHRHVLPWLAAVVLLAAGSGGAWWFMHPPPLQARVMPPMKVPVMTVAARTVPIYRSFPATTQAIRLVTIQARVTGYLVEQGAVDGADVASGALLYRIDDQDYQVSFAQAQAQLALANASLRYSRVANGRNRTLARDGWVSQDTADQTNSTFDQGQATLASNDAALSQAALNLSRTQIRAPFAGRISASQVFTGSLISVAGATLNTLVQLDPIYVSFNPAEVHLPAITREQARQPVEAAVSTTSGAAKHEGVLTFIDNQVSQSTGTILIRATVANPDHALLPGEYVTVRLHLGELQGALLVPQSAVGSTQIGRTVMVIGEGNKVEQHLITLGDTYGDAVVVLSGLQVGDRVITGQLQKLRPDAIVEPTDEAAAAR